MWTLEPCASVAKSERADAEYTSHSDIVTYVEWRPDHPDVLASVSATKGDTNVRFHDARTNKQTAVVSINERNLTLSWAPHDANQVQGPGVVGAGRAGPGVGGGWVWQ